MVAYVQHSKICSYNSAKVSSASSLLRSLQLVFAVTFLICGEVSASSPDPVSSTPNSLIIQTSAFPTQQTNRGLQTTCSSNNGCVLRLNTSEEFIDEFVRYTEIIFTRYKEANTSRITFDGLNQLMMDLGVHEPESHDHDHDHAHEMDYSDGYFYDLDDGFNAEEEVQAPKCRMAIDIVSELYPHLNANSVQINLEDFTTMLPMIMDGVYECLKSAGEATEEETVETVQENRAKVWGIAIISVAVISLLSVIGILIVPLMRHSGFFNRLISFLVALAVGTLTGDALLHLLPHAMGDHDHGSSGHEGHDHGDESKEKEKLMKSLAAVFGMYIFFVVESVMGLVRKHKESKKKSADVVKTSPSDSSVGSPIRSDDASFSIRTECIDSLLIPETDLRITNQEGGMVVINDNLFPMNGSTPNNGGFPMKPGAGDCPNVKIANGHTNGDHTHRHTHTHTHTHHNHEELLNSEGIKDLAWMIIMGDGLHNFSDGLAIGAAFSSSIAAGLGTSLAVFCHELPHELGDFAILLQAGMSIKKAVLYNGLSACMAFIGVIIGLLIGEYTTSVKLWLLAVTAGGFLYVALVDMLPTMKESALEEDGFVRFIFQNIGFILGVIFMLLIALYEENFGKIFS